MTQIDSRFLPTFIFALCCLNSFPAAAAPATESPAEGKQEQAATGQTNIEEEKPDTVIKVRARANNYSAALSNAGNKSNTKLSETPQSVQVLDRQLIDDIGARKLDDVLNYASSVKSGGHFTGWDYYRIRGYDASRTAFQDNLPGDNYRSEEVFGMERVEVLKGPATTLFGASPISGMVNFVSKKPVPKNFGYVQLSGGSFDFYEPAADIGLTSNSKKIYTRLVALYRHEESFVDFAQTNRVYIAPSLTWRISNDTDLTVLTRYVRNWGKTHMPLPARGTVLSNPNGYIPIHTFLGSPDYNDYTSQSGQMGYQFRHAFGKESLLRHDLRFSAVRGGWNDVFYPGLFGQEGRTMIMYPFSSDQNNNRLSTDTGIDTAYKLWVFQNKFTIGADSTYKDIQGNLRQIDYDDITAFTSVDVFNPQDANYRFKYLPWSNDGPVLSQDYGVYVQNQAKIAPVIITTGARVSYIYVHDTIDSQDPSRESFHRISPRLGINYEFTKGWTLYSAYSESFQSQVDLRDTKNDPLDPITARNVEGGLKADLYKSRLVSTLAAYHLVLENIGVAHNTALNQYIPAEQTNKGIEYDISAGIGAGWNIIAAYTYTHAQITKSSSKALPKGVSPPGVPEHSAALWTKYTIQKGIFKRLGAGAGARYYSKQEGDKRNTFRIPAYYLVDCGLFYSITNWQFQLNVYNLLDQKHFVGSLDELYVLPGEPLAVRGRISYTF